jgi:hypothetical protein
MTTGRINQVTTRHGAGGSAPAPPLREWQGRGRAADVKNETSRRETWKCRSLQQSARRSPREAVRGADDVGWLLGSELWTLAME